MTLEEIKLAVRSLPPDERRKIALLILELERDHFQENVGPQLKEDLEGLSRVVRESLDKIKSRMK